MSSNVLQVRDLWVRDAWGRALVCGVTVGVGPGERVGLVGESGSGKTLTARSCMGLAPADLAVWAAEAVMADTPVFSASPEALRRMHGTRLGYIPQNTMAYLQPSLRVRTQMIDGYRTWHPGVSRQEAQNRAAELLTSVGIEDPRRVLASYPSELSGGQRQRVNIATALMGSPALLVADEPTAALDSVTQAQVVDLLSRITQEREAALLMVSHDLGLVRRRCDRVLVMYAGRCVECGATARVLGEPGHPYTRALLASVPYVGMPRDERLADMPGVMPDDGRDANACTFAPRCRWATERCHCERPPMMAAPDGAQHEVACWHAWGRPDPTGVAAQGSEKL